MKFKPISEQISELDSSIRKINLLINIFSSSGIYLFRYAIGKNLVNHYLVEIYSTSGTFAMDNYCNEELISFCVENGLKHSFVLNLSEFLIAFGATLDTLDSYSVDLSDLKEIRRNLTSELERLS